MSDPMDALNEHATKRWQAFLEAVKPKLAARLAERDECQMVWRSSDLVANYCLRNPQTVAQWLDSGALDQPFDAQQLTSEFAELLRSEPDTASFDSALRRLRQRRMCLIAWRDLAGLGNLEETLRALSELAEQALLCARDYHAKRLILRHGTPQDHQGQAVMLSIFALGKLGGRELNFSSDVDLVFGFEGGPDTNGEKPLALQQFFTKLGQAVIASLDQVQAEGMVFRVDMRLRPNGDSGPLVLNFDAMEAYFQQHGRPWERYAWIKARPLGDDPQGTAFLQTLRPFIYRKYLDFSAFDAIRDMKGQIEAELLRKGITNNIKLGPGGIREAEFLVQSFQLIRGGRQGRLQTVSFYQALQGIVELGLLPDAVGERLRAAYEFLRDSEHRLQMFADRQTQLLPDDDVARLRLALSMAADSWSSYIARLAEHRDFVSAQFTNILVQPDDNKRMSDGLLTVWQGQLDDQQASAQLSAEGFDDADSVVQLLSQFRQERLYQSFGQIEQQRLDRLLPLALREAALSGNSKQAISNFIGLIEAIGHRAAYFSLLIENPLVLKQFMGLSAASPWIFNWIIRHPVVMDELMQPAQDVQQLTAAHLQQALARRMENVDIHDQETVMNDLRDFHHGQLLKIAAADVVLGLSMSAVTRVLSDLARVLVAYAYDYGAVVVQRKVGEVSARGGVVAYGKFGSGELGYHSDLDIILLFDGDDSSRRGEYFYSRLSQRFVTMLTSRTPSGLLYELDFRLRPGGQDGPMVASLDGFERYQLNDAWTWEHQALVRAQVVHGDAEFSQRFNDIRRRVLCQRRVRGELAVDVVAMRDKMRSNNDKSNAEEFDLKLGAGGIVDIEFMLQFLVLAHAADAPAITDAVLTEDLITALADAGVLSDVQSQLLRRHYVAMMRLALDLKLKEKPVLIGQDTLVSARAEIHQLWSDIVQAAC